MTEISRTSINCNHISINVVTAGPADGKMILLLHGFPESSESWMAQIKHFADLGHFVVAPDQRGYNETSAPGSIKDYLLDTLAQDMIFLVKHFRKEKVFIVAHDWGALVGWYLITFFPENFEKAVIASAPHWNVFRKYLLTHPLQIIKSWYIFFIQLPVLPELVFSLNSYSILLNMLKKSNYPDDKALALKQSLVKHKKLRFMLNWYRAMRYLKIKKRKTKIPVPTLIIWGEKDSFCLSEMAWLCRKYCDESKVVIMKEVGHWPHHQKTDEFNSLVEAYFI